MAEINQRWEKGEQGGGRTTGIIEYVEPYVFSSDVLKPKNSITEEKEKYYLAGTGREKKIYP